MNIAELFINLGVKGDAKTLGGVLGVKKGLNDTASASLEAKAAILGVMYGLERMFAQSSRAGQGLANFNALVGVSAQTLQQYQYAGRQVGVTNEAVEGTFKNLQSTMTKVLLGERAPKLAMGRIGDVLKEGFTTADVEEFSRNPQKLFDKLQRYAMKEKSIPLRNEIFKNMGIGEDVAAGFARNAFRPEMLAKAPTYSDREIVQLDKAAAAWSNLSNKIEMAFGHFNAKHGVGLVNDIDAIAVKLIKLAESMEKFSKSAHVFETIGKSIEGWKIIIDGLVKAVDFLTGLKEASDFGEAKIPEKGEGPDKPKEFKVPDFLKGASPQAIASYKEDWERQQKNQKAFVGAISGFFAAIGTSMMQTVAGGFAEHKDGMPNNVVPFPKLPSPAAVATPKAPGAAAVGAGATSNQTNNINQTLNFAHPGVDPHKTEKSVKQAAKEFYRQSSAQGEGG